MKRQRKLSGGPARDRQIAGARRRAAVYARRTGQEVFIIKGRHGFLTLTGPEAERGGHRDPVLIVSPNS
jgi:hypothetical protein